MVGPDKNLGECGQGERMPFLLEKAWHSGRSACRRAHRLFLSRGLRPDRASHSDFAQLRHATADGTRSGIFFRQADGIGGHRRPPASAVGQCPAAARRSASRQRLREPNWPHCDNGRALASPARYLAGAFDSWRPFLRRQLLSLASSRVALSRVSRSRVDDSPL